MIKPKRKFVKLDIKIQFICYNRGKVLANVTRTLTPHTYTTTTKKSIPLPKTFTFHGQQQQQQKKVNSLPKTFTFPGQHHQQNLPWDLDFLLKVAGV